MNYKAKDKGGRKKGNVDLISHALEVYTVATVYDVSGFRTVSKYNLIDQKGNDLYYHLDEERFDGVDPTPFQRHGR